MQSIYYEKHGEVYGPIDLATLEKLFELGQLTAESLVCLEGQEGWTSLEEFLQSGQVPTASNEVNHIPQSQHESDNASETIAPIPSLSKIKTPRSSPKARFLTLLTILLIGAFGGLVYEVYPLTPQEYWLDYQLRGKESRYPLIGENYAHFYKRFQNEIIKDAGETPKKGRAVLTRVGSCEQITYFFEDKAEFIAIFPQENTRIKDTIEDVIQTFSKAKNGSRFELVEDSIYWDEQNKWVLVITNNKDADPSVASLLTNKEGFYIFSEKGIDNVF